MLVTKVPRTGLQPKRAHSAHVTWKRLGDSGLRTPAGHGGPRGGRPLQDEASWHLRRPRQPPDASNTAPRRSETPRMAPEPPTPRAHQENFSRSLQKQNPQMFNGFLVFLDVPGRSQRPPRDSPRRLHEANFIRFRRLFEFSLFRRGIFLHRIRALGA